jgi:hypothetical protein
MDVVGFVHVGFVRSFLLFEPDHRKVPEYFLKKGNWHREETAMREGAGLRRLVDTIPARPGVAPIAMPAAGTNQNLTTIPTP